MFNYLNDIQNNQPNVPNPSNTGISGIGDILAIALNVIMGVGFSLAIISIAYAGIQYITSSGDPKNTQRAFSGFLWGAIAAAVTLLSFVIKNSIIKLTTVSDTNILNATPGF